MFLVGMVFLFIGLATFAVFSWGGYLTFKQNPENSKLREGVGVGIVSLLLFVGIGVGVMIGYPQYLVWQQEKEGEAALAKASQDRQIKVQEAEAEKEAALSQAEANKTLGESVRQYPETMEQKWVEAIRETQNQVIYLPTECSVPVTEAGRVAQKGQAQAEESKSK